MDRDTRKQAQLACQISLGLMAGIFSIVPTVAASPVQDTSSSLNTGATVTTSGSTTTVAGNQTNNVVAWKDFSVASGETVHFNGSTPDARDYNYLNVVTGANTSRIAGTIEGGNNVYIVNQHGVIFDEGSTVNVGNLYVSTKAAGNSDTVKAAINNTDSAVLTAATTGNAVSDVVNLGTLSADVIQVEGKNIRFLDSANVLKADGVTRNTSDVTLTASGYAHVGHDATTGASTTGYTQGSGGKAIEDYTLVSTLGEIGTTGNYMLSQDIDASKEKAQYDSAPIDSFNGNLDGMFYEVQNLNISSSGNAALFGTTTGGRIENLGITGAKISSFGAKKYAASVVGEAANTTLLNVYNESGSVSGKLAGGLVGHLQSGSTLQSSYNASPVAASNTGGGLAGRIEDGSSITDCYNSGNVTGGAKSYGIGYNIGKNATITRVYNTGSEQSGKLVYETSNVSLDHDFASSTSGEQNASTYASWDLSDDGTTNTTWRIYEGQSTPYLTAFFKGDTTATYDYNYFTESGTTATQTGLHRAGVTSADGVQVVSNNGADVTVTYNGQYYKIANPTTTTDSEGNTVVTTSTDADDVKGYVSFGSNVDGTDSNITINTAGLKDVKATDSTASSTSPTVTKQSLISSGQHGYNIVGGNVTINQRTVTLSNNTKGKTITKTYDGTKDVTDDAITTLFSGSTVDGLIEGDDTVALDLSKLTASFDSKNAGTRTVSLNGTVNLKNADGKYNYTLSDSSATFTNASVDGTIYQKKLTLSMNSGINLTREYNGKNNSKVAATSDSSTGAKGGLIEDADSAQAVFTLDGIIENAIDDNDTTNTPHKDSVALGFDTTKGYAGDYVDATTDADGNVTYTKTGKAGKHTVEYSGLTLTDSNSGVDASNYYLVDSSGNIIYRAAVSGANDGAITNNLYVSGGKITKKNIATDSFTLPSSTTGATKAYDGDEYLDFDQTTTLSSGDIVSGDTVNFTVTKDSNGHAAWFSTTKDGQTIAAKDVGTGYGITYNVEISGDDVENYTLGGNDITLDATTKTATGSVTGKTTDGVVNSITPRIIKLGLGTTTSGIDKEYDGNNTVYVTENGAKRSALTMADGYVAYADGTTTNTSKDDAKTGDNLYKIIDGINGENVTLNITGTYADTDGNVHVDSDGNPEAQNITYTISLKGDTNGNYAFDDSGATSTTISSSTIVGGVTQTDAVTPTGTITPRTITASIGKTLTKTYDTLADTYYLFDTNQVGGTKLTSDDITITSGELVKETDKDLIFTDDVMDAVNKSGRYGYKDASGTFHEDANVLSGDNATNATAQFTGLSSGSNNYKLSTEPVYADGSKITPYEITDIDLTTNTITKVYDAKTGLATSADNQNAATKAEDYIKSVSATHNGQQIGLTYDTVGDDDAYYIHKSDTDTGTATKNVTEANAARFLVKIDTTSPNYTIASSLLNDGKVQLDTAAGTASITPRTVLAKVKDTSEVTKTYDGFSALDHSDATKKGDNIVTLTDVDGTSAGLLTTLDNATNTSTGKFRTKDVAYNHTYDADGNDTGSYQKKDIDYYVTLDNGDTTTQGNYAIYAADTYNSAANPGTAIAYNTQSDALKGQGTITARTLKLGFEKVKKTYTGTTSLEDGDIKTVDDDLNETNGTVGEVKSYDGLITTNENNVSDVVTATTKLSDADGNPVSHYDTAANGSNKTVTYNVSFTGADVGNYCLADNAAPLIATTDANAKSYEATSENNVIGKKAITSEDEIKVAFGDVTKVYDGSKNVQYDHTDTNVYFDGEQGSKDAKDYITTTDDNATGLKIGGISIATDKYSVVNDATYNSSGTDASTATFHFNLDATVLDNFDFTALSSDVVNTGTGILTKSTTGTITAKSFDFTFTPLENHSQVYNGTTTVVDNSQTTPTASAKNLSSTISNVAGLVDNQSASVLNLAVAGDYDTKNAGTGKTITYGVTFNNSNYQFRTKTDSSTTPATVTSYDGKGTLDGSTMKYTGTGDIEQKTLTLNVSTPLEKVYDGTADVLDDSLKTVTFDGLVNNETLKPAVDSSTGTEAVNGLTGTYTSSQAETFGQDEADVEWDASANGGKGGATYKAFKLANVDQAFANATGTADKANYKLADAITTAGNTVSYAKTANLGKITPLAITTGDVTTSWDTITKEYDNTKAVLNPENYFHINVNKTLDSGSKISTELKYNLQSAEYAGKDVGTYDVTYTFDGIQPTSLRNFTLGDDVTNAYAPGKTATSKGTITPRTIHAWIGSSTANDTDRVTKTYDGTDAIASDLSSHVSSSNLLSQVKGATDDGAVLSVSAAYDDENVAYDVDDKVTTKDVIYTLSIGGQDAQGNAVKASNYAIYDQDGKNLLATDTSGNSLLTDKDGGLINRKTLTLKDVTDATRADGAVAKDYDSSAAVKNLDGLTYTLDGLVSKDRGFALSTTALKAKSDDGTFTGTYGTEADGTGSNAHVNRTENTTTGAAGADNQGNNYYYKSVYYKGLQNVLDYMRTDEGSTDAGKIAGNYTIADTAYFAEAAKRGTIKPLAITSAAVRENWSAITKTYDANSHIGGDTTAEALADAATKLTYNVRIGSDGTLKAATDAADETDTVIDIPYTLQSAEYYDAVNGNLQKDQGKNLMAKYVITDFAATALDDFDMGDDVKNTVVDTHWKTGDATTDISITPKVIDVALAKTELADKVYDATTAVKDRTNSLIIDNGKDDGNVAGEAEADKVKVVLGEDYVYGSKNVGTQTVTYTAKLENNDKGNYTLKDGATTDKERDEKTLDATGEITKRTVYVDFKDGTVPTIADKEYGETTLTNVTKDNVDDAKREVLNPGNYRPLVVAADADDDSGILDSDVSVNTGDIKLSYANNGNVARTSDGTVTTQTVLFDNVALKDSTTNASGNASNYEIKYLNSDHTAKNYDGDTVLAGKGKITPKTIQLSYDNATELAKEYDGTSDASGATYVGLSKTLQQTLEAQEARLLLPTDTLNLTVTGDYTGTAETEANGGTKNGAANIHSNKTEGVDDGKLGVDASVTWTNGNYDVTFDATDASKDFNVDTTATVAPNGGTEPDQFTFTKGVTTTQGTITPKTLTMAGGNASKTYTGTSDIEANLTGEDATGNTNAPITFDGIVDHDKNANSIADLGTAKGTFYYKGTAHTADNEVADANDKETDNDTERDVEWTVTLTNEDYRLADDGTMTGTVTGTGIIKRAELTFASDPVQSRFGQTPAFTGTVTGWANGEGDSFDKTSVTWNTAPGTSVRGTSSAPIYGWYRYDDQTGAGTSWSYDTTKTSNGADIYATDGVDGYRNFGNYGKNYTIVQQPGQFTSQADRPDGLDDVLNPARRVRPDMEVYNHVTHDDVGTVIRDPKAGIEYEAGGTSLQTDGSASYNGTMTVEGAGEVVNLTQSGTAASADRVDLTNGSANYTLSGAENVPTADVTVADVTEDVASEANTASATAAAGATSAASTTGADDTTVTDDDDDAVKAAAESSDEREAEATVEYADQAPSLFSEAITGTNVAS